MSGEAAAVQREGKALVFGASGMIGARIAGAFAHAGVTVLGLGSRPQAEIKADVAFRYAQVGRAADAARAAMLAEAPFDRVVWAQGVNSNDSVYDCNPTTLTATFEANVVYVAATLQMLVAEGLLQPASRLCVVSSIWQTIARQNKLSYTVSKAALQGLVASAAVDLARDGHFINAILPGVLDTEMTRAMLAPEQRARVENATLFGRLPDMADVVAAALFFCSAENRSITGQFLAIDLGFRSARLL